MFYTTHALWCSLILKKQPKHKTIKVNNNYKQGNRGQTCHDNLIIKFLTLYGYFSSCLLIYCSYTTIKKPPVLKYMLLELRIFLILDEHSYVYVINEKKLKWDTAKSAAL